MGFKARIKKIVLRVKLKNFSELRRTFLVFERARDYYMSIIKLPLGFSILFVDQACKQFNEEALEALIVHELCHLQFDDERLADMEVIKLGYGHGLLEFHGRHNKKYKRYKKTEGLTHKEIEDILYSVEKT